MWVALTDSARRTSTLPSRSNRSGSVSFSICSAESGSEGTLSLPYCPGSPLAPTSFTLAPCLACLSKLFRIHPTCSSHGRSASFENRYLSKKTISELTAAKGANRVSHTVSRAMPGAKEPVSRRSARWRYSFDSEIEPGTLTSNPGNASVIPVSASGNTLE